MRYFDDRGKRGGNLKLNNHKVKEIAFSHSTHSVLTNSIRYSRPFQLLKTKPLSHWTFLRMALRNALITTPQISRALSISPLTHNNRVGCAVAGLRKFQSLQQFSASLPQDVSNLKTDSPTKPPQTYIILTGVISIAPESGLCGRT